MNRKSYALSVASAAIAALAFGLPAGAQQTGSPTGPGFMSPTDPGGTSTFGTPSPVQTNNRPGVVGQSTTVTPNVTSEPMRDMQTQNPTPQRRMQMQQQTQQRDTMQPVPGAGAMSGGQSTDTTTMGSQTPRQDQMRTPGTTMGTTTGTTTGGTATGGSITGTERGSAQTRMGPAQREMEQAQTTLLNRFGQMGFSRLTDFRKEGENYVAQVVTREGESMTVLIDPRSGSVTPQR
ncbi:MAG TPA: hypothetical protein VEY95_09945 [Azospirillaceae bacterium]|nr:hypothetical protein [Azospirillaceae bacterium]